MPQAKTQKLPQPFLVSCYTNIALITMLLDKSRLSSVVKKHCKTGLKVLEIIYAHQVFNTGTNVLSSKEFDAFFKHMPAAYFNNREDISIGTLIKNIKQCIATDHVANT
ncbi:hypothetical protein [Flavivirga algicola]|uniref:Uncharacterized protein n=1 Tax=Flavivirga algicola TaxID=2729136 RepID=A0ABX1S043_9FLAO|nr:hypothetical protein [Flavivirga algicola]NMH89192.1 hypothetical protein [Flavivirga algicola]